MNQAYRLRNSILGIQNVDGKASPVVIPTGAILDQSGEEHGFATCTWEGCEVQVLISDLHERGILVDLTRQMALERHGISAGGLTERQREVLKLISEGKSMKEIANLLTISVRTVEFHKNGIIEVLGVRSIAELTRYALEHGITGGHSSPD